MRINHAFIISGTYPLLLPSLNRDKEPKHTEAYDQRHEAAEKKYLLTLPCLPTALLLLYDS